MTTGFTRDDTPRDFDAVKRTSGLWVAGAKYLDHIPPAPEHPEEK